ncbi:MAG: nuclear transport factor 2 family protein [Gemmatimonadota bacterium]
MTSLKRRLRVLTVCLVASTVLACSRAEPVGLPAAHAAAIRDSVRATLVGYVNRFDAADWDSVGRFYLDDPGFIWAEDGQIGYHSVKQLRDAFRAFHTSTWTRMEFPDPEILALAPGSASVVTSFRQTVTDSTGRPFTVSGVMMLALLHQPGGWKFVSGHTSTEKPTVGVKPSVGNRKP